MKNWIPIIDDFDLSLHDSKGKLIISSNGTKQNLEFIKYKVQEDGFYTFKINQYSKINDRDIIDLAFTSSVGTD